MPKIPAIKKARQDAREGKSANTQAGEFVREEIENIRAKKHGARSTKQAIAIGLSKARRAGVKLPVPDAGKVPEKTRQQAKRELARADKPKPKPSRKRSIAATKALKRESHAAASPTALSRQAKTAARKRTAAERSASAQKASRTKGAAVRQAAAKKAARTRARQK